MQLAFLLLVSLVMAVIPRDCVGQEGGSLSETDIDNYIYCADLLNQQITVTTPIQTGKVLQIPPNLPASTNVEMALVIIQVHEVSDEETFAVTAQLNFAWFENRLVLNDTKCWNSSATFTVSTVRSLVWYPQWTLSNGHKTIMFSDAWQYNPAIAFANGNLQWKASFNFETECAVDATLFPFDVQACSIDITSPHYSNALLTYTAQAENAIAAQETQSLQSPLWKLIGGKTQLVTQQYPSISFRLLVQRRPGFYTVSLILPIVVVNIVTAYTFLLPAFQEEKTSTAGAAVVAYFFILIMFFNYVPMSSDHIPGLIVFLTINTFTAVIAYLVECRLIRFAEEKKEEEEESPLLKALGLTKKENKVVPLEKAVEEEKKKGPFDGISPDYINDWCLIGYLVSTALCCIVFFHLHPSESIFSDQYFSQFQRLLSYWTGGLEEVAVLSEKYETV